MRIHQGSHAPSPGACIVLMVGKRHQRDEDSAHAVVRNPTPVRVSGSNNAGSLVVACRVSGGVGGNRRRDLLRRWRAVEPHRDAEGDRRGHHRRRDPRRGHRRRRHPDRARLLQGRGGRGRGLRRSSSTARLVAVVSRAARSWSTSTTRSSTPTTTTNAEIQACENDVAAVGTSALFLTSVDGDAQLQGLDRCSDRPARHPVRVDRVGAAVLGPVVPHVPAAGDLLDRDRASTNLPAQRRAGLLLREEVRPGPPRRLPLRQLLEVGP